MYIYHIFIHSSVDGHLGYLCILAIVNNVAMNIGVHVSFQFSVLILEIHPGIEFLDPAAAAAAAKLLQLCPTLCNPIDGSPRGSPVPGILQARTMEWVAISFSDAGK